MAEACRGLHARLAGGAMAALQPSAEDTGGVPRERAASLSFTLPRIGTLRLS
jgi:hypothetical protein